MEHLVFKRIRAERPAMAEDHRLSGTPVFVVDLRAVFGRERTHGAFSFGWVGVEAFACSELAATVAAGRLAAAAIPALPIRNRRRDAEGSTGGEMPELSGVACLMVGIVDLLIDA
jgi:hypothetical protein